MAQGKAHVPTDLTRQEVKILAEHGHKDNYIAKRLGLCRNTYKKYYRDLAAKSRDDRNNALAATCFEMAIVDKIPQMAKYLAEIHLGWTLAKDNNKEEEHQEEAQALEINFEVAEAKGDIKVTKGK